MAAQEQAGWPRPRRPNSKRKGCGTRGIAAAALLVLRQAQGATQRALLLSTSAWDALPAGATLPPSASQHSPPSGQDTEYLTCQRLHTSVAMAAGGSVFAKLLATRPAAFAEALLFESKHSAAIMDKFPLVSGHTLVISKRCVLGIHELSDEEAADFGVAVARATRAVRVATGRDAYNLAAHIGEEAGQEVMHLHMHVVPRTPGDFGSHRGLLGMRRHRCSDLAPQPAPLPDGAFDGDVAELRDALRAASAAAGAAADGTPSASAAAAE